MKQPMLSAVVQQDVDQKQVVSTLLPCAMLWKRLRQLPDFSTCADQLQTWNQPRPQKLLPIPVEDKRTREHEIMPPK